MTEPHLETHFDGSTLVARVSGDCTEAHAGLLNEQLGAVCHRVRQPTRVVFECAGLGDMDASGAWLIQQTTYLLKHEGFEAEISGFQHAHFEAMHVLHGYPASQPRSQRLDPIAQVDSMGRLTAAGVRHFAEATAFLGHLALAAMRCLVDPRRTRSPSITV